MAANMYEVYDVTIEKRYGIGKNEKYPIVLCTPGGNYVGYSAKLILDFLNKGELSRLEQGIDDMPTLYMLYLAAVSKRDNLQRENEKLKEENEDLKRLNYQYENQYKSLKEKTDYLIYHLNKVLKKLPEFIQNIVERLFNYNGLDLKYFKQQYNPKVKQKEESRFKGFNLFNKKKLKKQLGILMMR